MANLFRITPCDLTLSFSQLFRVSIVFLKSNRWHHYLLIDRNWTSTLFRPYSVKRRLTQNVINVEVQFTSSVVYDIKQVFESCTPRLSTSNEINEMIILNTLKLHVNTFILTNIQRRNDASKERCGFISYQKTYSSPSFIINIILPYTEKIIYSLFLNIIIFSPFPIRYERRNTFMDLSYLRNDNYSQQK